MKMKLKELRKNMKITQKEVATQLGVSIQAYSSWETEKTEPSNEMLKKLADFFGVSIDELFTDESYSQQTIKFFANTPRERELLRLYRKLNDAEQINVLSFILGMVSANESYARLSSNDKLKTE